MADINQAHVIAMKYAQQQWPNAPMELKLHYHEELPDGGYAVDNRHSTEPGWFHFAVTGTYFGVGGCPFLSVHPVSGEIRSLGTIGE